MTEHVERRLAAIFSADVVGYTRLMHGDEEGTLARWHALREAVTDPKISEYKGRIVKLLGDGILAEFPSVVDAVRCATDIQRAAAARNVDVPDDKRIVLRIGINLGDIIVEGDDIQGDGVNVATRMQEIAPPGGVSVSGIVYDSVRDKLAPAFEDLGPQHVKNLIEPVRAYRIVLEPEKGGVRPAAPAIRTPVPQVPASDDDDGPDGSIVTVLSSSQRRGAWRVPQMLHVVSVMGSIDLDFREALFAPGVTEISVTNIMSSVTMIVPTDIPVKCDGIGFLGQFDGMTSTGSDRDSQTTMLRIGGFTLAGLTTAR